MDFTEIGYDIIGGTAFGGLAGIVEFTIAGAVAAAGSSFVTAALVTPLALITGAIVFAGAVLTKQGSRMVKANTVV